jgi:UDP-3-O-[3-hydroxymyristoyl] glucosamine N-acyltransferase|tara:strand:+ start:133 stop:1113 length:981 start_codon:yes stop_codon:yes gene_type:complete
MSDNIFFINKGPFAPNQLFKNLLKKNKIRDVKTLDKATENDITFYESIKYRELAKCTKASCCITSEKLKIHLPTSCEKIIVSSVLFELAKVVKKFYPKADIDYPDLQLTKLKLAKFKSVKFGNNVLIGKNVKIGKNSFIGSNTIIESNVRVGSNCIIGSQVIIKNTIIGDEVVVQDGCKIGLKGFGFIPTKNRNFKFPHVGKVILKNNVEIASSCTIDRGSLDDTIIGENTYLDNQVHVGHNVKIGSNCMIAGQVGFAGSSSIGDNVSIGGQAGISGHLKIGNNVKIGGGSGVIKDIEDNCIVMGYPAVPFKKFIKNWKKNDKYNK